MTHDQPRVGIVLLHWKGVEDCLICIQSLIEIDYPNWEVFLVLNGASDDDEVRLRSTLASIPTTLIKIAQNVGVAAGRNAGLRAALTKSEIEYILILDTDVVVEREFLGAMVDRARADVNNGIVGAKIYHFGTNQLQFTAGRVDLWRGLAYHHRDEQERSAQPLLADYVQGACFLVSTSLLREIGLFDEQFAFYGWEETDFCLRARQRGYHVVYEPHARIWHKVNRPSDEKLYYLLRNTLIFMRKHARWYQWISFVPYFVFRTTPLQSAKPFLRHPATTVHAVLAAYRDGLRTPLQPLVSAEQ